MKNNLIKYQPASIEKVGRQISITNMLVISEIQNIFNEAFYLINSKKEMKNQIDYFKSIISDSNFIQLDSYDYEAESSNDYEVAANLFTKILLFQPQLFIIYLLRGISFFRTTNYKLAIKDINKFIEINQNISLSYHYRGESKINLNDFNGALSDFSKIIELEGDNPIAYFNRALIYFKLKYYQETINDFTKVIELNPIEDDAYNGRGVAKGKLNDFYGAIEDFESAIKINPNNKIANENLEIHENCYYNPPPDLDHWL